MLGRAAGVTIFSEPGLSGKLYGELTDVSLKQALDILCAQTQSYWEDRGGWIAIGQFKTLIYSLEYPTVKRLGTSNTTVSVSGSASSSDSASGSPGTPTANSPSGNNTSGGATNGAGTSSISVAEETASSYWDTIEAELLSLIRRDRGETLVLNKFTGIAEARAGVETHERLRSYIDRVNLRAGRQVHLVGKIVEVKVNDQRQLGIDWSVAAFTIAKDLRVGFPTVPASGGATVTGWQGPTFTGAVPGFNLNPSTASGSIGLGKVDTVIRALEQQGSLRVVSNPNIRIANNSTAIIQDGEDRPFFRRVEDVNVSTGGTSVGQTIQSRRTVKDTYSIGLTFQATPQISDDGRITLAINPVLTRLTEVITAEGGQQSAPVLSRKLLTTLVSMQDGEVAVVGGLTTETSAERVRSVPGLSRIPLLGRAFQDKGKVNETSELVIILEAKLVQTTPAQPRIQLNQPVSLSPGQTLGRSESVVEGIALTASR